MTLRVNARRSSATAYVQRLAAHGVAAQACGSHTVVLAEPCPVTQLPGFADGEVSVQDAAAQLAAPLLLGEAGLPAGARVLDACAAPGGKAAHLLELADLDLLALDSDPQRLARVQQTLDRLHLHATVKAGDARDPASWWDGRPFAAILLDAPCSASGIVRRHPDIRWLRRPGDIAALARIQAQTARRAVAAAGPRWSSGLRHLLGVQGRGPAADRRFFATPGPGRRQPRPGVAGPPAAPAGQCDCRARHA